MLPSRLSKGPPALSVTPEEPCTGVCRKCRRKSWHDQTMCAKPMIRWKRLRTKAKRKSRTCLRLPKGLWNRPEGDTRYHRFVVQPSYCKSRYRSKAENQSESQKPYNTDQTQVAVHRSRCASRDRRRGETRLLPGIGGACPPSRKSRCFGDF